MNKQKRFFLKPIGCTEHQIQQFPYIETQIHFAKKPNAVSLGSVLIEYAVGSQYILGSTRVISLTHNIREEGYVVNNPNLDRWPWFVEAEHLYPIFSKEWWHHKIKLVDLVKEFNNMYPESFVTVRQTKNVNGLMFGADKIGITSEFADFIFNKIQYEEQQTSPQISPQISYNFEDEIKTIEKSLKVPGTQLSRCLSQDGQIGWVLGIGELSGVKNFFYGKTISEVIQLAKS